MRAVLVTGSARGLGAAVAERLRRDGYAVVGGDVAGGDVHLDVRSAAGWDAAAAALSSAGEPWGLVNCAARTVVRDLFSIEPDEWDDVLAVNLRGPFLGIRAVAPLLRERGAGRIVNVSSDAAFKGRGVIGAHYAASKAALVALTRRAAGALAKDGVTVNAVVPGTIDGETVRELAGDRIEDFAAEAALGRLAAPAEIAALIAWVLGDPTPTPRAGHIPEGVGFAAATASSIHCVLPVDIAMGGGLVCPPSEQTSADDDAFLTLTYRPGRPMTFDRGTALPADQSTVRRANLGVVLRHVASAGSCSRAQIATETGLTRGTVSSLVTELSDLDLVRETGEASSPRGVGRPGVALELADVIVGVGLEVNVDYVAVLVEDLTGAVRYERRSYRDNRRSAPEPVLDRLAGAARAALDAAGADRLRAVGVSIAVPGLVEQASGTVVLAPNLGWHDVAVAEELEARLGLAVQVENESNLAALAEHWTGAAVGIDDFVCVFGEVGVGGGVVLGGRLFRGSHGFGGEFGHVTVDADGRRCACGSRGCVETVVGQEAIARAAGIPSTSGRTRSLTDELVRRAEEGSPRVVGALRDAGRSLGVALASTFNVLDLRAVVLGGCFGPLAPWLVEDLRATLEQRSLAARSGSFVVLPSAFGDGAAVRGAAALPLRRVLDAPWVAATAVSHSEGVRVPPAPGQDEHRKEVAIGRH